MENIMELKFITTPSIEGCPAFIKEFQIENCKKATLEITGLGLYIAFLNDEKIGDRYLTPGCNDYDAYLRVQSFDVTHMIRSNNCLRVVVGNGWYKGRFGMTSRENIWGDKYLLGARLTILHVDGSESILETDDSWQVESSVIRESSIYDGEVRDDTIHSERKSCVLAETEYLLEEDKTPPVRCVEILSPTLIVSPKKEQILDFGQNFAGVVRFHNRLPKGEKIHMLFGEVLQEGCFYRDNLRDAKAEFTYTSDGVKKDIEPWFTYYGFRYVKVEGLEKVSAADFTGLALSSDLKNTLKVETDSPKINQLMKNALWGQRSNFLDVPTDCPQRNERLGWTADTQVFVNTACYHMDCKEFYRKYTRDMREDQVRYFEGDIPTFSPSVRGEAVPGGAVWADAGTIIPWNIYRNYGDVMLLKENWPLMHDYTEKLIEKDVQAGNKHIIDFGFTFGDWLALDGVHQQAVMGGTDNTYIRTIYYWNSVNLTAKAAEVLQDENAKRYASLAEEIYQAIIHEYFTPAGHLAIDTQTGYVLALYYGLYTNEEVLVKDFRRRLQRDSFKLHCGFTGTPLVLLAMMDHGMVEEAYRLLYNEQFPGWLYAVNLGATTIWERWNSMLPDGTVSGTGMNSFNHYAYGSVCEAIYSRIAGLRCGEAGWKTAIIQPHFNYRMKKMDLEFKSPVGVYGVHWRILEDGSVDIRALIPEGAEAQVILPEKESVTVAAGEHHWICEADTSLVTPFSIKTPLVDLLEHPATKDIVLQAIAGVYSEENSEMNPFSLEEIVATLPMIAGVDLQPLDMILRQIRA